MREAESEKPSHSMCTTHACPMLVHCIRLLPGDDVLLSLKRFITERSINAAAVLSAVGSTAQTVLRPAGLSEPRVFDGKFEVVSFSGTIGNMCHHLHMSISDADCRVLGGHVMPGCLVRTTLELVIGEIQGVAFIRPMDVRTGFDEVRCHG